MQCNYCERVEILLHPKDASQVQNKCKKMKQITKLCRQKYLKNDQIEKNPKRITFKKAAANEGGMGSF